MGQACSKTLLAFSHSSSCQALMGNKSVGIHLARSGQSMNRGFYLALISED